MLSVRSAWLWRDIAYYQREVYETGMLESQRALHFPRHAWSSGRDTAGFCSASSKREGGGGGEGGGSQTHKQTPSKTPKPIILPLREMKHEASPQGMTTEADTHSLSPVLLSYSTSLQTALLQLFKIHSIITPEPFVKPQY